MVLPKSKGDKFHDNKTIVRIGSFLESGAKEDSFVPKVCCKFLKIRNEL